VNTVGTAFPIIQRLYGQFDPNRYKCITPDLTKSPIISFEVQDSSDLEEPLRKAAIVITLAGNYIRVSPAVYNSESDIDLLADVLNRA
jgi:selenocysteine lyase/cysteine desulfurase